MVKLPHDGSFRQEVPPLAISVAHFESFYGYDDLSTPRQLEAATTHFSKLSCEIPREPVIEKQQKRNRRERKREGREV